MRRLFASLASVFMVFVGPSLAPAPAALVIVTYPNPEPNPNDSFGCSVTSVGNNVLVGAYGNNAQGTAAGAAYLFTSSGNLLHSWHGAAGDEFGYCVAARGNDVLVGAYAANGGVGGAYLFDGATYQSKLTIVNPTPNSNELFGNCVAAMGNNILVAAQWNNPGSAAMCGAVYLYDGTSGTLMHTFQPPVIGPRQFFGTSVSAVGNNEVLIGAECDNKNGYDSGAAYLYGYNGSAWSLLHEFYDPNARSYGYFGRSVAARGQDVLISSYSDTYLFDGTTWDLDNTFPLNGSVTAVGANVLITPTNSTGPELYSGTTPYQLLQSSSGLGDSGAALGNNILVGYEGSGASGSAYLVQGVPEPSTLVLLGAGVIGLLGYVWQRRSAKKCKPGGLRRRSDR